MGVDVSNFLWRAFDADHTAGYEELLHLAQAFAQWKQMGGGDFDSELFGKDVAYQPPYLLHGDYELFHVHMAPTDGTPERTSWNWKHARRTPGLAGRKTSQNHLIYTRDDEGNYLLVYYLHDGAHEITNTSDADAARLMRALRRVGEAWKDDRIAKSEDAKFGWSNLLD